MGTGIHSAAELWHIAVALVGVLGGFVAIDRHFWAPVRQWRQDMERWRVGIEKDLERGKTKMDETKADLRCLDTKMDRVLERLTAIETLMRAQGGIPPEA